MKASVFIATSLDGFIARPDGSIDWLDRANGVVPQGEDCGYAAYMATIDVLVMGRNTYELVRTFGEWPYGTTPVVVLSHHAPDVPDAIADTVSISKETPGKLVARLAAQGAKHLYIDGGRTIQSFLQARLIDELIITTIPVLIGTGRPLFGPLARDVQLVHLSTKAFDFGFVQQTYRVLKEGEGQ